ncbi:polynucleotide kinase 3 phosphatase-domain-containing protein [Melampsora americana]|nr:polynucleotide kinase 3 phosphatase-domain-containing protein [Melampsora americana]
MSSLQTSPLNTPDSKTNKRKRNSPPESNQKDDIGPSTSKTGKLAPIFMNHENDEIKFKWFPLIHQSCLHGTFGNPNPSSKIAAFDIDSTLITTKSGNTFPRDSNDWKLWNTSIPKKLKQLHSNGFTILLISNQKTNPKQSEAFEKKIPNLAKSLKVPFRIFAARKDDFFRKPRTGMWEEFIKNWNGNLEPDLSHSYYVGDAAGRPTRGTIKADFSDTDRKWALNIGISFFTPEEFFLNQSKRKDFVLKGFDPFKYDHDQPAWTPTTATLAYGPIINPKDPEKIKANESPEKVEIVLFVGSPAIGKTRFYKEHFEPRGYEHINQDKLKTFEKCLKLVKETIKSSKPCVIDNTNPSKSTRLKYIKLSQELKCDIRCVHFDSPMEIGLHNNIYRGLCSQENEGRSVLPFLAFGSFQKGFEEPMIEEGFSEPILKVRFKFLGTGEERKRWEKYLS